MGKEATEGVLLPAISGIINPEVDTRGSAEKAAAGASLSPPKDDGKTLPHHLRPSTGSCHDFCKYGRKHSFRLRGKRQTFRLSAGIHTTPEKEQNQKKSPNLAGRQKKSAAKQMASAHLETGLHGKQKICAEESPSSVKTIELVEESEIMESPAAQEASEHLETGLPDEQRIYEEEPLTPVKTVEPLEESGIIDQDVPFHEKNVLLEEFEVSKCSLPSHSNTAETFGEFETIKECTSFERIVLCDAPETIVQEISSPKKSEASVNSETADIKRRSVKKTDLSLVRASTEQRAGSSRKPSSSSRPKLTQKVPLPAKKAFSSGESKVSKQEAPPAAKRLDASAKPAPSGKSKVTPLKPISLQSPTGTKNAEGESRRVRNASLPISGEKKALKPLSASRPSQPPLDQVSDFNVRRLRNTKSPSAVKPPKKPLKTDLVEEKVKEKTIHVVEPRPAGGKSGKSAFTKAGDSVSEHGRAKMKKDTRNEGKRTLRRVAGDEDPAPHKLTFRRGKVVTPLSANDGPRRLKFRQGRIGISQGGRGVGKRSFKGKELACEGWNHPCPEVQIVVLRHQEVQDKRESQVLFNDVIEETASKLVEAKKSKVKALVGAFETVISLQENKPATPI